MQRPSLFMLAAALASVAVPASASAQAAHVGKVDGALLVREGTGQWKPLRMGDVVPDEKLVIALPQAEIVAPNGAVHALLLADVGHRTAYPVLEAGLALHKPEGVDLDLTLDRGIVGVMNFKKQGAARVRLRFRDQNWLLTLRTPDTRVGIEIYGRHAPGLRKVLGSDDEPVTNVVFLVTRGEAFVDLGERGFQLQAPPGTALLHWDTLTHMPSFEDLDKAPRSLRDLDAKEAEIFKNIALVGQRLTEAAPGDTAAKLLGAKEPIQRLAAVVALGALDDLPGLFAALGDAKQADVRDQAVLVLRHWLGRCPGQTGKLLKALRDQGYSEKHGRTIAQLLLGFNDEERARPATYEVLLGYLNHSQLPVRHLVHWHLVRLAPAGKDIAFDAAAPEEARQGAIRAWRGVIPEGELPRRTATKTP
jgi:hypothetical protein